MHTSCTKKQLKKLEPPKIGASLKEYGETHNRVVGSSSLPGPTTSNNQNIGTVQLQMCRNIQKILPISALLCTNLLRKTMILKTQVAHIVHILCTYSLLSRRAVTHG